MHFRTYASSLRRGLRDLAARGVEANSVKDAVHVVSEVVATTAKYVRRAVDLTAVQLTNGVGAHLATIGTTSHLPAFTCWTVAVAEPCWPILWAACNEARSCAPKS